MLSPRRSRLCPYATVIGLAFLFAISSSSLGRAKSGDSQIIASFIYNMADYANWKNVNEITICTYGYDEVSESLKFIKKNKADADMPLHNISRISIRDRVKINELSDCEILYFSRFQENAIPKILDQIQNLPILTISNIEHFVDLGGIMELKIARQKLKLRLGKTSLENGN